MHAIIEAVQEKQIEKLVIALADSDLLDALLQIHANAPRGLIGEDNYKNRFRQLLYKVLL